MIGAFHLQPTVTLTLAAAVAAFLIWYWLRLGRSCVPCGRRRVRRLSLCFMFLTLPVLVRGLSFVDPAVEKRAYLITWTAVLMLVLIVLLTAFLDVVVSLKVHRAQQAEELMQAGEQLRKAIQEYDRQVQAGERPGDEQS